MTRTLFATAALALASTSALAGSPDPACQPYLELRAQLDVEGEKVLWAGRSDQDSDIVVLTQADGHSFTIVEKQDRTDPNGEACMIHRGSTGIIAPAFRRAEPTAVEAPAAPLPVSPSTIVVPG